MFRISKSRLEAISDAIMAIIITIMALEIPVEFNNGVLDYKDMISAIILYFITFCFIGSIWYQHSFVFDRLSRVTNKMVVLEFVILFLLSIMPVCIKVMVEEMEFIWVSIYGILNMVINLALLDLRTSVIKTEYKYGKISESVSDKLLKLIKRQGRRIVISNLIAILIGIFVPEIAMIGYLILSVYSFFTISREKHRKYDYKHDEDIFFDVIKIIRKHNLVQKDVDNNTHKYLEVIEELSKDTTLSEDKIKQLVNIIVSLHEKANEKEDEN